MNVEHREHHAATELLTSGHDMMGEICGFGWAILGGVSHYSSTWYHGIEPSQETLSSAQWEPNTKGHELQNHATGKRYITWTETTSPKQDKVKTTTKWENHVVSTSFKLVKAQASVYNASFFFKEKIIL